MRFLAEEEVMTENWKILLKASVKTRDIGQGLVSKGSVTVKEQITLLPGQRVWFSQFRKGEDNQWINLSVMSED